MSAYCVQLAANGGNDAFDGLAWTYDGVHGPKATPQAGCNAVPAGGGHFVVLAGGGLWELGITAPTNSGVAGAKNWIVGDTRGDIQDIYGATSGRTGEVVLMPTTAFTYMSALNLYTVARSHWGLMNVTVDCMYHGSQSGGAVRPIIKTKTALGIELKNVTVWCPDLVGVTWEVSQDDTAPDRLTRVMAMGPTAPYYITGGKTISPSTPNLYMDNCGGACLGVPSNTGYKPVYCGSNDTPGNVKALLTGCWGFSYATGGPFARTTAAKTMEVVRCVSHAEKMLESGTFSASTDCYQFGSADAEPSGWTELDNFPLILFAGIIKGNAAAITITDFSGELSGEDERDIIGTNRAASAVIAGPFERETLGWQGYTSDDMLYDMGTLAMTTVLPRGPMFTGGMCELLGGING